MTGDELREMREAAGLTQAALADMLGVKQSTVYRWEHGQRGISGQVARHVRLILEGGQ